MQVRARLIKSVIAVVFLSVCVELTAPWVSQGTPFLSSELANSPRTYEDYYIEAAARLTKLDEQTLYVLQVCKEEGVDPLEMLAILQVENPQHKTNAVHINYKKVWNKKLRKYVKKESSRDEGLFQLNSGCKATFEWHYWKRCGEMEEFDPMNYKHSTRVAVRLHKTNKKQLNNSLYYAVLAYNSGVGSVLKTKPAKSTVEEYWPLFTKYYVRLRRD